MSKALFAVVKELIAEKEYDEARAILKTIKHPTAREIEARLDDIAPQKIDLFERKPVTREQKSAALKTLFIFIGIVVLLVLADVLVTSQHSHVETYLAYLGIETALPTSISRHDLNGTLEVEVHQTSTAYIMSKTESFNSIMRTVTANLATSDTFYNTLAPISTAPFTLVPTPFISVSPTTYYAVFANSLNICADTVSACTGPMLHMGQAIEIIGITEGAKVGGYGSSKWYVIHIPGDEKTYYRYADDFKLFTLNTPMPSRTPIPISTPTSTPTHHA